MRILDRKQAMPYQMVRRHMMAFGLWMGLGAGLLASSLLLPANQAHAQSTESNSALMARQQMRLNTIEDNLKSVRGTLETEFRAITMKIQELSELNNEENTKQASAIKQLKAQISELGDTLDIFNQRLRRSIELSSDVEFRVMRLEKRMQTLLALGSDELNDAILQDGVNAGGTAPAVSMSRDNDTGGATWTVEKDEALETELAKSQSDNASADNASTDNANLDNASFNNTGAEGTAADEGAIESANAALGDEGQVDEAGALGEDGQLAVEEDTEAAPASVLPDGTPEEQYRFAFGRMLQNDLETAEAGFAEFRQTHPEDERAADVLYWLGRVQFIQGDFSQSAMSFTAFNQEFPNDARLPEAILMVAESVMNFADAADACQIFADLPQMLDQPSQSFVARLDELKVAAACEG